MSHPLISRALRRLAWIAAAGAVLFAVAAPFSAAPSGRRMEGGSR
jgi:hypothetical protein